MFRAERDLLDGLTRLLRARPGAGGWVLLLSRLAGVGGGPRPYHRRIVRAVLEDVGLRHGGQLFALTGGDVALLYQPSDGGAQLSATVARLFGAGAHALFRLPGDARLALDAVQRLVTDAPAQAAGPEPDGRADVIAAMDRIVQTAPMAELMQRQTAVLLRPGPDAGIVPLFREVGISTAVLERRLEAEGASGADPFLFGHLAARLDGRMLATLTDDVPRGGPVSDGLGTAALHLNLTVAGIMSEPFAAFAAAAAQSIADGLRVAVELPFIEVVADPRAFVVARERLRLARMLLVLDGVEAATLCVARLETLAPHLVKLLWSEPMLRPDPALRTALDRLGPDRIVLHRVAEQRALAWGVANGIMRHQGHYIDRMLAARSTRDADAGRTRAQAAGPDLGRRRPAMPDAAAA